MVSSPTLTGPADPAFGLARAQKALGVEVRFAFDQVREGSLARKCEEAGLSVETSLKLCTTRAISTAPGDVRRLRGLAERFDVVHVHTSHDHALATTRRIPALVVRSIHHPRSTVRRGLQGWVYRRTDGLIFVAEAHRRRLLESYPRTDPARTEVVEGAVDAERFHPAVSGARVRADQGVPEGALLFGMIARIKPGRGHRLLLAAFAELACDPPPYLALIGKGEGEAAVRAEVTALGLEDRVRFYGFRDDDLPEAIRSLDASILLAEGNDASCRAVLESMASGVPVIGAELPAIRSALQAGGGILIPPGDRAALVKAMTEMAAADRNRMGAVARERILEGHTDRVRGERVLAFYRRLEALQ